MVTKQKVKLKRSTHRHTYRKLFCFKKCFLYFELNMLIENEVKLKPLVQRFPYNTLLF